MINSLRGARATKQAAALTGMDETTQDLPSGTKSTSDRDGAIADLKNRGGVRVAVIVDHVGHGFGGAKLVAVNWISVIALRLRPP
jgi:hypothetical protein